jgi:hypothetical protein
MSKLRLKGRMPKGYKCLKRAMQTSFGVCQCLYQSTNCLILRRIVPAAIHPYPWPTTPVAGTLPGHEECWTWRETQDARSLKRAPRG